MLLNGETYFKNLAVFTFLKYVWPFYNIMHERVKRSYYCGAVTLFSTLWTRLRAISGTQKNLYKANKNPVKDRFQI